MKSIISIFCISVLYFGCGSSNSTPPTIKNDINNTENPINGAKKYASTITSKELKELLYVYASDEFEGRETGEKGQKIATEYLKMKYESMGILSPLEGNNYFQKIPLEKQQISIATITVNYKTYNNFDYHLVLLASKSTKLSVNEIVYVGYGIDADNYSDYTSVDVRGKIVLAKAGEPKDNKGNYVTSGNTNPTKWTNERQGLSSKRDAAKAHGAKGLLLMDNNFLSKYSLLFKNMSESGISDRLSLKVDEESMIMLVINEDLGKALYTSVSEDSTPKTLNVNLDLNIENESKYTVSHNVVAFIEGSEKPNEIIVISAHLDHEGIKDGEIYNGADDDGSGTVAILEIAEAFKTAEKAGEGPKRSILFLHVTGEEKGLLGSRYYTDFNPVFPLENTVANLNIDMIGRTDPNRKEGDRNYVYLIGSDKLSTDLHNISEDVNKKCCDIEFDYTFNDDNDPNRFYYRSDHYNFAKNNIPIIFYFNGIHEDYHKPTDTVDKIEYDLLENRTRLIFYTAWEIANRDARLVVDKATE